MLEGVAFALADGQAALAETGARVERVAVLGGGARSRLWLGILAAVLDTPLFVAPDAEVGPAFGAARLARLCDTGEEPEAVCHPVAATDEVEPEAASAQHYREQYARYRALYGALRERF